MKTFLKPCAVGALMVLLAGCAAPACRPVADSQAPVAPMPPPAPAPVEAAPVPPPPPAAEPGYLHASGGAFY